VKEVVMSRNVVVVIGVGGMGQAFARRADPGNHVVLADFNAEILQTVTDKSTPRTRGWMPRPHLPAKIKAVPRCRSRRLMGLMSP
jgi:glycerol-3-phosphate dehydrogenase